MAQGDSIWHEILEVARWAPSPHNTQPWHLTVLDEERAELFMVAARRLPDEDTTGCFLVCAMGIFIEAIRIAAANRGRGLLVRRVPQLDLAHDLIPYAQLKLEGESQPDEFADRAVMERRTSRLHPQPGPLPEFLHHIQDIAAAYGHRAHAFEDRSLIDRVMDMNAEAVMHDLADPRYGGEIRTWYRYTRAHAERTRDGLDARCMNVPAHEMWLSARWPWLMRSPATRSVMKVLYRRRVGPANAVLALSGPFFDGMSADGAGGMLLRIWLRLHEIGLTMHPFGNLVTNAKAHRRLTEVLGAERVWLVARVGRTAPPRRSLRLNTREILRAP